MKEMELELIRVCMFLVFGDFSEIYKALEMDGESEPEETSSRNCGELEANTLQSASVSVANETSLGVLEA